jgi:hypothetical protein
MWHRKVDYIANEVMVAGVLEHQSPKRPSGPEAEQSVKLSGLQSQSLLWFRLKTKLA